MLESGSASSAAACAAARSAARCAVASGLPGDAGGAGEAARAGSGDSERSRAAMRGGDASPYGTGDGLPRGGGGRYGEPAGGACHDAPLPTLAALHSDQSCTASATDGLRPGEPPAPGGRHGRGDSCAVMGVGGGTRR